MKSNSNCNENVKFLLNAVNNEVLDSLMIAYYSIGNVEIESSSLSLRVENISSED
jgi:hypothetical protein